MTNPKPTPANPDTFAAMLTIAERIAEECKIVINAWESGQHKYKMDWPFKPIVDGSCKGRITITVLQNRVLNKKASQELLRKTRRAILDAWTAAGYTAGERQQRSCTGGRTWLHTGGLFHMGVQHTDWRRAILIPRNGRV